tara:strand:- start:598 stop:1320 length:723 start_codon:yes stop_codon:yes gene_type:complete
MWIVLTVTGFFAATLSATIGMAGGTFLLAAMLVAGLTPFAAIPLHAAVQLFSNGTRGVVFREHLRWKPLLIFLIFMVPGPFIGLSLFNDLPTATVTILLSVFIFYATWAPKWGLDRLPENVAFGIAGVLCGLLGVVIGAVGPVLAPFFLRGSFTKEELIGTKALCQCGTHLVKIIAFASFPTAALQQWELLPPLAIAVILGTFLGKKLLSRLSEGRFTFIYKMVLTLLAIKLLHTGLTGG